ncbi:MAG: hypothetical protein H8E12_14450, partial [Rhodobacteraceae bacterium]|nr:hypothetical protein [Paracoccaceae bacterium]
MTSEGLPKPGAIFYPGEYIAAYLEERDLSNIDRILRKMHKSIFTPFVKKVVEWDEDEAGTVIDVRKNGRTIDIYLKAVHPFKEGDKLSGRYGNKNIVTKIIADSDAPQRADGSAIDIMVNPHGVPGRMNIGQILETAASKLAKKQGKPYLITNFESGDMAKKVLNELKGAGIDINEKLTDGKTGDPFDNKIFVGSQYFMKLRHHVKKKQASHSIGTYDINEQPTGKGTQKADPMLTYSMLSHGAKKNLYEMTAVKGRQNDEYWRRLQMGLAPGKPAANYGFDKMLNYLKAAGVNTEKQGNKLVAFPLTDKDVLKMSSGELPDPGALLIGKNLMERKGGLFDSALTGGPTGKKWSHISLATALPSPMYEQAIIRLLDLTKNNYTQILEGKQTLNDETGIKAIKMALKEIDVKTELRDTKDLLDTAAPSEINKLNKKVRYLKALEKLETGPHEAYFTKHIPVLPPMFRPIYPLPSGDLMVSDMNKHYKDLGVVNKNYSKYLEATDGNISEQEKYTYDYALYTSLKALQGFTDPLNYSGEKYKGVIKELAGEQVKHGLVHSTTWSKRQDVSARSTITGEPSLGLDEVGLPMNAAKSIYKPFIVRELVRQGMPVSKALKEVKDDTALSKQALKYVAKNRPVLLNRAPSLHKHSILAFNPILHEGKSIKLNPLVV